MFERRTTESHLLCAVNRADCEQRVSLPWNWQGLPVAFGDAVIDGHTLVIPPYNCAIITKTIQ